MKVNNNEKLLSQLIILRRTLLKIIFFVLLGFIILLYFSAPLFHAIALPLLKELPAHSHMIATGIMSPLTVPIKFSFIFSLFCCMPFILFQIWRFVAPGLYRHEKRFIWTVTLTSVFLFYLGIAFAYLIVCPLVFKFIVSFTPAEIKIFPDIQHYLSFILRFLLAFGLAFEVPVLMLIIVKVGLVSLNTLRSMRRYFIVLAFILGMILTPPDIVSQILLAIPLWILYEFGLLLCRFLTFKKEQLITDY